MGELTLWLTGDSIVGCPEVQERIGRPIIHNNSRRTHHYNTSPKRERNRPWQSRPARTTRFTHDRKLGATTTIAVLFLNAFFSILNVFLFHRVSLHYLNIALIILLFWLHTEIIDHVRYGRIVERKNIDDWSHDVLNTAFLIIHIKIGRATNFSIIDSFYLNVSISVSIIWDSKDKLVLIQFDAPLSIYFC